MLKLDDTEYTDMCADSNTDTKHCENREKLPRQHLIGCQVVKMFLLKDPLKFFLLYKLILLVVQIFSQFEFLSCVTI